MAGKAAAPGTAVLLVTANVGSLFDDPENLQKNWLREFYQVVHTHRPHFLALHCQEFGGKNYEASMSHVDKFVRELLSSDAMTEYNRARVYLDENYKSQEHFTALGSFYFLHESLKNISQFDFKAKKYKKVTGKEIYSDTLESTPMLEKEKFPQDYFPECKWSRKGFIRTRWCLADCAFDLVNIHLFHDASNLVAWETSPSVYSGIRHKALGYVLDRIIDQRFEKAFYFVFGDFNFRLDSKSVVEGSGTVCTSFPSWAPADPASASPALGFPRPGRPWTCPRPWCPAVRAAGVGLGGAGQLQETLVFRAHGVSLAESAASPRAPFSLLAASSGSRPECGSASKWT
ncbi:inositol polyphosphate-5-phosphatase A isoform X5 [Eubalaena glacialis]|uniref:inositol polyphosphate-5-phosphatase A isoform X5 n=1 Tax=Eubalaena glacialis TaxID=27606 RepID=UPI002A5985BE|nr:inositol polyphosphate-5-phosphatase A isoform X5 [Eubalaena glacialis]